MPDNENDQNQNQNQQPNQPDPTKASDQTPPWGKDEDFDPARAWSLIQNLRTERDGFKTKVSEYDTERQQREDAEKTELQKLQDKLAAAEKIGSERERALIVAKTLRKYPELEDLEDLLTGETEEEIVAKAERLAKRGKGDEQQGTDPLTGRPRTALTPGHNAPDESQFDPDAIARNARRR